ncbi:hypothetical protein [Streptomyces sp. NPDC048242]|uniref:hypothetical protein n=1 Tax=Streptomyces sp. NPDC048242 TaxID=3155026 RepID=UPI00342027B1
MRITGVPPTVVMWVDHERDADVLCLNADLISEPLAQQLDHALQAGCTARELIKALVPQEG